MAKIIELVNALKTGKASPQDLAKSVKDSLPPQLMAFVKLETTTPESIIAQLEPFVAGFMGKETVDFLKTETTTKLLAQALVILRTEN